MTAYKLVDKSCFINVSARLDPIEGYRGEEGPPPKLLSSRGFRGFRGSRPPLPLSCVNVCEGRGMKLQGPKALRPIQCVRRISSAIPRRQKFAKWPPRVRPQRILPERANAELHCLEVLASAPFEGQEWNPQPSLFLGPPQKLFSAWSACFQRISPPSLPPLGSVYRPPRNWLVGQRTAGRQCIEGGRRERGRAALKTICAKTQKPQTSDGRMTAQS